MTISEVDEEAIEKEYQERKKLMEVVDLKLGDKLNRVFPLDLGRSKRQKY